VRRREIVAAQLEERLRLAYVALTRAQVRVWVCSYTAASRTKAASPLDWLLRPEDELAAYPAYAPEWVEQARTGRASRHRTVLEALNASAGSPDPLTPLITTAEPPGLTTKQYLSTARTEATGGAPLALPPPAVPERWRVTSFSTLTREKHAHGAVTPTEVHRPAEPGPAVADEAPAPVFLAAPGGAAVGTAVHDWIETWDFGAIDAEALQSHLAGVRLPAPAAGGPGWSDVLAALFADLREVRLPGAGEAPLRELCPEPHGSEWHFHLPLRGGLAARDLARCFAEHAAPEHRPYAVRLRALAEGGFNGLLQGFIDRLVRHGPVWGVVDWKTNRLGPTVADYDGPALLRCAMDDHYLLQTHLYLVALRRYLRSLGVRDATLAGAWLVFLRAIEPGTSRGVLQIAPPPAMLDALEDFFAPGEGVTP
jgi:exodeoxyribonuclease V beta subunit